MYLFGAPGGDIEALIDGLDVPDKDERKIAEFALFAQGERAIKPLIHALTVDDPAIRMEAARVLVDLHLPEAAPALIQALNDRDENVRAMAASGLVALKEYALRPILERLADAPLSTTMHAELFHVLLGLEEYGVLRGDLKAIIEALKLNLPTHAISGVAEELLKQVR